MSRATDEVQRGPPRIGGHADGTVSPVEVGILGPLELVSGGERVALGGPKQRLVLALLVARRGRVVTVDDLIDGLWPEGPQDRPRKTVQVYVTRLRRALGDRAEAIRSEAAGYVFDAALVPVDADAFKADVRAAAEEPDDHAAGARLRAALDRWRGVALADLRDNLALLPTAVQLDEQRLAARYELFEREIRVAPRAVLGELERTVDANPLHEGFAAQLMTAQYRAGRQADALGTYQALRRRLGAELGLDPSPAVRELEGRILRHELEVATAPTPRAPERQRRLVSIVTVELAVRVDDAPVDPEDELAIIDPLRSSARARLRDGGGVLLADHGGTMTACFGYPSSERSVERALLAALSVRDLGSVIDDVEVRVGVDTGVVVIESPGTGDLGTGADLTGIAGEPLRAAARLATSAARNEVLASKATADDVSGSFDVTAPAGGNAPPGAVAVIRASAHAGPGERGPLLGRAAVAQELGDITARAPERLCPVAITGPPGVGKSALVESFLAAADPSWSVVRLRCDPRYSSTPLHPFRHGFGDVLPPDQEPTTRAVVAAIGERAAGRMPVLFVEDVHAADPSTLELLDELPHRLAAGLLLLTTRTAAPIELGGDLVPHLVLGPLDRSTARELAAQVAGGSRLRIDVLNEIADRSGGIPLHVEALTRAAIGGARPPGRSSVPTTLYDSLMARLDELGSGRALAQRCAVLGESFAGADVPLVHPGAAASGGGSDVAAQLAQIVSAGVLVGDGVDRYRFAHALVADAAYESLLHAERAELHARVAAGLSREVARAEPERLAFHLEAAGRTFEAAVEWRQASANAIRMARHREAQHHARRSLQLLDQLGTNGEPDGGDTRRRALTNLAIGLQATSHGSEELLEVVELARRAGGGGIDLARQVVLEVIDVSNRQALGDLPGAIDVARMCVAATEESDDELSAAWARQFLGASLVWHGDLRAGIGELDAAASYWEGQDDVGMVSARPVGALWALLGLGAGLQDRADEAAALLARARTSIPDADGYGRCLVAVTGAIVDQLADRPAVVREVVEPVWSLAMDLGSDFWLGWAQVMLGWSIAADDPSGLAMMAEAIDASTTRQALPYFHCLLGSRTCEHGDVPSGLDLIATGLAVADQTGEQVWAPLLHLAKARWLEVAGDRAGALAAAEAALIGAAAADAALVERQLGAWRATLASA